MYTFSVFAFWLRLYFFRFYSLYGHVEAMAREIQRGANTVQGVEATLWQVVLILVKMRSHYLSRLLVRSEPLISWLRFCLTQWSRYLKHYRMWFCKRWEPLPSQVMWRRSSQNSFWKLTVFFLVFRLVLVWCQHNARHSLTPLVTYGKHKHLLANLLESFGVLAFMEAARSLLRE